ncbi:MAG TPA: hypothetical protein VMG59_05145 [Phycisphaerae bacterium]|nr:hypothetical protein [Phycisphaerae bacterium]
MGTRNGPMKADFPTGTIVRIATVEILSQFMRPQWKFHHPIEEFQLGFAGREAKVRSVGYYHGGDELYWLDGILGIWHEKCLEPV